MQESNPSSQKHSDDNATTTTSDKTKHCPECGDDILFITRRGPATATAQPCGHSLGSLRVRDLATTSRQDVEAVDYSVSHEELMGRELRNLNAAYNGLDAYYSGHTDGHVTMAEGGRCLIVITQNRRFKHFQTFQREHALEISNVTAVTTEEDGGATEANEPRLKVEIKAAEGVTA
jgi:hypothetical protein